MWRGLLESDESYEGEEQIENLGFTLVLTKLVNTLKPISSKFRIQ